MDELRDLSPGDGAVWDLAAHHAGSSLWPRVRCPRFPSRRPCVVSLCQCVGGASSLERRNAGRENGYRHGVAFPRSPWRHRLPLRQPPGRRGRRHCSRRCCCGEKGLLWGGRWALGGGRWRCECLVSVTRMALRVVFVACLMSPGRTIVILLVAEI